MAGPVSQSGTVTPGHFATWVTDGVVQDGGPILASEKVLGSIRGANFNTTSDQPIVLTPGILKFQITKIIITNASLSLTTAAGGFYTQAAKTGSQIVANSQTYSALTASTALMTATLANFANTTLLSSANLSQLLNASNQYGLAVYFALTTPQGAAATADVYLVGIDLT